MMRTSFLALSFALSTGFAAPAQELNFSPALTKLCFSEATDKQQCIGLSAEACMEVSEGGFSTVGMGGCLEQELNWWDAMLNRSYQHLMTQEKADDAEAKSDGFTAPSKTDALKAMQRAWIPHRDATCDYEMSQWGGGTGGGPAILACLMRLTGEQTIYLNSMLRDD